MKNYQLVFLVSIFLPIIFIALPSSSKQDYDQIKQEIIDESIAGYSGVCACPYQKTMAVHATYIFLNPLK